MNCSILKGKHIRDAIKMLISDRFFLYRISEDTVCIDGCKVRYNLETKIIEEVLGTCELDFI